MKSREDVGTSMVRPDRSRVRSDRDKPRSVARIPAPPAARRGPNPRPVARSGPRTVSGRADTPRLAVPDPLVPRLSGRCPARATASRRQARSTIESVGASSYGVPVRSPAILAHHTRRFQPTSPSDVVVWNRPWVTIYSRQVAAVDGAAPARRRLSSVVEQWFCKPRDLPPRG